MIELLDFVHSNNRLYYFCISYGHIKKVNAHETFIEGARKD